MNALAMAGIRFAETTHFYDAVSGGAQGDYGWLAYVVWAVLAAAIIAAGFIGPFGSLAVWAERRIAGRMQARIGPNRVGPLGLLQSIADGIKLIGKEDIIPTGAERFFYRISPGLVFAGAFVGFAVLPFGPQYVAADVNIAVFFVLAVSSVETIGIIMAGWAPNNKYSLIAGVREAAQVVAYEIPLALFAMVAVLMHGSLSLMEISANQVYWSEWGVVRSPIFAGIAFVCFYIASLAECKRAPFDLPEAESELVAGYHTEYTGMRFGMFFFAEYASMYLMSALAVILFLGSWNLTVPFTDIKLHEYALNVPLDGINGLVNVLTLGTFKFAEGQVLPLSLGVPILVGKSLMLVVFMILVRWTLPRYRIDQVIYLCYKVLLPFALLCLLGQALWTLTGCDNWAVVLWENLLK